MPLLGAAVAVAAAAASCQDYSCIGAGAVSAAAAAAAAGFFFCCAFFFSCLGPLLVAAGLAGDAAVSTCGQTRQAEGSNISE